MLDFIQAIGWTYSHDCGCNENKRVYTHSAYPRWQVWVNMNQTIFEMRRVYNNSRDTKVKGRGGSNNYQTIYNYWVNQDIA